VVVGIGAVPNVELAAEAGLAVAAGIIVNEQLLSADSSISAVAIARFSQARDSAERCG
jgi:3-phenylpropionate/trans-cinnamate dioxygenase ferredoxin reductase subunit